MLERDGKRHGLCQWGGVSKYVQHVVDLCGEARQFWIDSIEVRLDSIRFRLDSTQVRIDSINFESNLSVSDRFYRFQIDSIEIRF